MPSIIAFMLQPTIIHPLIFTGMLGIVLVITRPVYAKFKRNRSGYGIVFHSLNGKPIDLARIRLVDTHGLTVASAVTDAYGHYRLVTAPGEYTVDVLKKDFVFPSIFLKQNRRSTMYDNVLASSRIKIRDYGIITKNIPIDPSEGMTSRSRVFRRWIILSDNAQLVIAFTSAIVAIAYPIIFPKSIVLWLIYIAFISIVVYRLITFRPGKPAYGTVNDVQTNEPITRVIIRLFDAQFNKLLSTQVTSPKGRYAFLVNRGSYYMTLQKEGYKTLRLNYPNITKDSYPLAANVRMKPTERA